MGKDFIETYHDFITNSVCPDSTSACFYSTCKKCPGSKSIIEKWRLLLETNDITEVTFRQWNITDSYS